MARKKIVDNDENQDKIPHHMKDSTLNQGKPFQSHTHQFGHGHGGHFLGGGTKNHPTPADYRHPNSNNVDDSFGAVGKQLSNLGLTIREMPGDGNCLFRSLSDQITGTSRNHLEYRRSVVQYMKEFRADFEPFVEDDVPFDKYVHRLAQQGTFAGNDAIVAFARLHNVSVVIHQLNLPAWVIHPSKDSHKHLGGREVHIFYHNGDHYNSVRRIGDDSESPTNIKLHSHQTNSKPGFNKTNSGKKSPPHSTSSNASATMSYSDHYDPFEGKRDEDSWVKDSSDIDRLVEEVMVQTNYPDEKLVRETLMEYHFDMVATIDFIISMSVLMNQHQFQLADEKVSSSVQMAGIPRDEIPKIQPVTFTDANTASAGENSDNLTIKNTGTEMCNDDGLCASALTSSPASVATDIDNNLACISPTTGSGSPVSDETDDGSTTESTASQEKQDEKLPMRKNAKLLSSRQRKELKKRERKREADLRKKISGNSIGNGEKENTVVISTLGSLDI